MRDHLLIYVNGQPHRVAAEDALLPLSEFLRRRCGLTGTKVVCAEGDCGSCAVLVGRPRGDVIHYASLTSCIVRLVQLDAAHVVTVEGLTPESELNPIQDAMVRCQGTQCGFCTPGFVVTLQELLEKQQTLDAHDVRRHLTGNLCRCTGYDSIVRAALEADRQTLRSVESLYPSADLIGPLRAAADQPVELQTDTTHLYKPASLDQATDFLARHRQGQSAPLVLAGGTDLGVLQNKGRLAVGTAIVITGLEDLQTITHQDQALHIGAAASLAQLEDAAETALPELHEFLGWFGSPLIRHAGTVAGNLCTASPIGDLPPAFYVLDAQVQLLSSTGRRSVALQDFQTGYRTTQLAPDELVASITLPLLGPDEHLRLYKISKRRDLDISSFSAAFWFRLQGNVIDDLRVAFGGVGPRILRLPEVEDILRGHPVDADRFEDAAQTAASIVTPLSDVRGTETYRRRLSGNILRRLYQELEGGRFNGYHGQNNPAPPAPAAPIASDPLAPSTR